LEYSQLGLKRDILGTILVILVHVVFTFHSLNDFSIKAYVSSLFKFSSSIIFSNSSTFFFSTKDSHSSSTDEDISKD